MIFFELVSNLFRFSFAAFHIDFADSKKNGGKLLVINGFRFFRNKKRGHLQYWKCRNYYKERCPAIAIHDESTLILRLCHQHQHMESNDIEIKPLPSTAKEQVQEQEQEPEQDQEREREHDREPEQQPELELQSRDIASPELLPARILSSRPPPPLHEYKSKQSYEF